MKAFFETLLLVGVGAVGVWVGCITIQVVRILVAVLRCSKEDEDDEDDWR